MSVKNGKYLICTKCDKKYYMRASRCENSRFCADCWKERNPPEVRECQYCKTGFLTYERKTKRFCSMQCRDKYTSLYKRGELANGYKDGKSLHRERARRSNDLKIWRDSVKTRDNYTCQKCGSKEDLHAHHIIAWAVDESKRFDINNGLTLCVDCHSEAHGRYVGFKKNKSINLVDNNQITTDGK